ncbi:MAG: outer membrane lipoprotein carrier protein LolA [Treponema sp.]|jgi:outer membrane lipoprotein-sorting protein|nr:outer membrane lipoprotein carrier protein LolA [Treponema sp.]
MTVLGIKRRFFFFFLLIPGVFSAFSQEIVTAEQYLKNVSDRYSLIRDYEALLSIRSGNTRMRGSVSHLSPSFLRIDFSEPQEQVIVFNGELLTVYLPGYQAVLNQAITPGRRPAAGGASMASAQGLTMLRRNFIPTFVVGPDPVPLEEGSEEMVVKLRLTRRSVSEGFRELILSIDGESHLIRRIEGRTIAEAQLRFDFTNVKINQGITEQRFIYDSPASANLYNNFLFRDVE